MEIDYFTKLLLHHLSLDSLVCAISGLLMKVRLKLISQASLVSSCCISSSFLVSPLSSPIMRTLVV